MLRPAISNYGQLAMAGNFILAKGTKGLQRMFDFNSLDDFIAKGPRFSRSDVVALILAEDFFQLDQTNAHHMQLGFDHCIVISRSALGDCGQSQDVMTTVYHDIFAQNALADLVNRCMPLFDGGWVMTCYNGEFLYFPFGETRSIADVTQFVMQEQRSSIPVVVVDAYPAQMPKAGFDVTGQTPMTQDAFIDSIGYHATARWNMDQGCAYERKLDMFGGLKWRFCEYVPYERRRIDRVALFQARSGLVMVDDFNFADQEYNTYQGQYHNSLRAAIVSYRTAKSLSQNPASRSEITQFSWDHSVPWTRRSQQLLDLGLIEAGQWF